MPCGLRGSRPDLVHDCAEPFGNVLRRVTGVVVEPGEHDHVEVGELGAAHVPMTPPNLLLFGLPQYSWPKHVARSSTSPGSPMMRRSRRGTCTGRPASPAG